MRTNKTDDRLLTLHRAGLLADEYPSVRRLLVDTPDEALARAGHLLTRVDPHEVLYKHPDTPSVRVTITGSGTVAQLVPSLTAELARHGLLLRPTLGDFDSRLITLLDPTSEVRTTEADLLLCVLAANLVFDDLPVPWRVEDVERSCERVLRHLDRIASAHPGTLVFNTMPLPRQLGAQLLDHRSRTRLAAIWRDTNAALLRLPEKHPSLLVVDLDQLAADGDAVTDPQLSTYAQAHLTPGLLGRYAKEIGHLARHITGRGKKCLVVDLDGTLWGGVLGDDGVDGIEVDTGYRGQAFQAFQRTVRQIAAQGVLVAAVSKNDADAVRAVFRDHPGMTLREEDFVRIVANWKPKHENLIELAADLNLALESFVFVDDSPYECGLVRHELPEVAVIELGTDPAGHATRLLADGWFDTRELTADDQRRPARYREELARKDFLDSFESTEDYLRELGTRVHLAGAAEQDVPRVSQLSLRTNQFNLTGHRLQQADVRALIADPGALVVTVRAADTFGDHGLVGAVFAHHDGDTLHVDNILLSCRVFARGIERATLGAVLRHASHTGAAAVVATYRAGQKNGKVRDFYPRNGFAPVADDGTTVVFRHDLSRLPPPVEHIQLTEELIREQPR